MSPSHDEPVEPKSWRARAEGPHEVSSLGVVVSRPASPRAHRLDDSVTGRVFPHRRRNSGLALAPAVLMVPLRYGGESS
jgi:hypothetical protein